MTHASNSFAGDGARRGSRSGSVLLALLLLSACAPDLGKAPLPSAPADYATTKSFAAPERSWPDDAWWKTYGDSELNSLIDTALAGAPDMRIAQARLTEAQAAEQQAGAGLLPAVSVDATGGPTQVTRNQGFPSQFKPLLPKGWHDQGEVTANLSYEFDVFGKNRAALAAATSDAEAAAVDYAAVRLALSTSIAASYADLVRLTADRAADEDAVRVREESANLVRQRFAQQLENRGTVAQAEAQIGAAQAELDAVDGNIAKTRNALAALLGKGPDRGLEIPLPANPHVAAFGLPGNLAADLVARRPDIVAARARAESAAERIKVAHADFYPNIDLAADYGVQSFDLKDLLTTDSLIGHVGPAIHLPVFTGGEVEGRYRGARADYDEAVATYDKTLVGAFHEVADALADSRATGSELAHSRQSLAASETAYRVATLRYQGGLSRYLDVLTAEDTLLTERRSVAELNAEAFSEDVALVRALGGGFAANTQTAAANRTDDVSAREE